MSYDEQKVLGGFSKSSFAFDTFAFLTFLLCFAIVSVIIIANYGLVMGLLLSIFVIAILIFYLKPYFNLGRLGGSSKLIGYEDGKMVVDISDEGDEI